MWRDGERRVPGSALVETRTNSGATREGRNIEPFDKVSRTMRWVTNPSPGMYYLLTVPALALESVVANIQKVVHHISS